MQLIGSVTSPFVRRLRLLLTDVDYDFLTLDIYSEAGSAVLKENNPAKKIPVLKDGEKTIFDSRVIFNYLREKLAMPALTWQQENLLTMIDAANDSLVTLFLCRNSKLPVEDDILFFNLQKSRIDAVLTALDTEVAAGKFTDWQYPAICLFCLLDWVEFRQVTPWQQHSNLLAFHQQAAQREDAQATDPR
ncbi:glutathione S-transferase family protein [Thalassotalea agariperforans]